MAAEASIEKALSKFAKSKGLLTYKFSSPSHAGVPDRIYIGDGVVLFLEIKAPKQEPTPLQMGTLRELNEQGAYATWVDNRIDGEAVLTALAAGESELFLLLEDEFIYDRHEKVF